MKRFIIKFKDHNELEKELSSNSRSAANKEKILNKIDKQRKEKLEKKIDKFIEKGNHFDIVIMDERRVKDLIDDDSIEYIEEDIECEADAQTVDYSHDYSGTAKFKAKHGLTGKGVTVAVMDSGIDSTHDDFKLSNLSAIKFDSNGKFVSNNLNDVIDHNGHGTSVAGVIAMQNNTKGYVGVAPDVKVITLKAMTSESSKTMTTSAMANVLNYLVDNKVKVDFVNISFSQVSFVQAVSDACKRAYDNGIIVVASAGNNGDATENDPIVSSLPNKRERVNFWKDYPNVVVVGALNKDSITSELKRAEYSSIGKGMTLTAPSGLYTAVSKQASGIVNGYGYVQGTSFSAPFVVGALALLKEYLGRTNRETVKLLLDIHTTKIGSEKYFGKYGVLNLDVLTSIPKCYSEETFSYSADTTGKGIVEFNVIGKQTLDLTLGHSFRLSESRIRVYADGTFADKNSTLTVTAEGTLLKDNKFVIGWYNPSGGTTAPENFENATLAGQFYFKSKSQYGTSLKITSQATNGRQSRIWVVFDSVYDQNLWSPNN